MEMEDTHMDIDSKVCVIIVRGYYTEGERERVQSAMQCSAQSVPLHHWHAYFSVGASNIP